MQLGLGRLGVETKNIRTSGHQLWWFHDATDLLGMVSPVTLVQIQWCQKYAQTATKKHGKHHAWEAIGNNTYAGSGPFRTNWIQQPQRIEQTTLVLKTRLSSACRRTRALQYLKFSKFRSLRGVGNDQLRLVVIKYHERRTGSSFSMIQHVGSTLGLALSMTYSIGMTHLHPRYAWWDRGSEAQSHHHCGSLTLAAMALTSLTRCFTNIRHGINIVTLKVSNCTNNSNVNRC